jgi:hypothetical protein
MKDLVTSVSTDSSGAQFAAVDAGPLGGTAQCADVKTEGNPTAVCGWADDGSVGVLLFMGKAVADVKGEFVADRGAIEKRT